MVWVLNINFMLVASGGIMLPVINIAIFADTLEAAKEKAHKAVAALHMAEYFQFTLFDTSDRENGAEVEVARFTVEEQAPLIFVTG